MFKVAPYVFSYYSTEINTIKRQHNGLVGQGMSFTQNNKNVIGKIAVSQFKETDRNNIRSYIHIQANYQNDITKDIIENDTHNNAGVLDHNRTILEDMFLIFCYTNQAYNLSGRQTQNLKKGILFVVYGGRINLSASVLHEIEENFNGNIKDIQPIHKGDSQLRDIIDLLKQIEVSAIDERTGRKTDINVVCSPELIQLKYGSLDENSITNFISNIIDMVSNFIGNIENIRFKTKANILGHKRVIDSEQGRYIIKNLPQHLELDERQENLLNELREYLITGRNTTGGLNSTTIVNKLESIIDTILNVFRS